MDIPLKIRFSDKKSSLLQKRIMAPGLDNPALVTTATSKATTAALLLMEMRNKAIDTYNELMRISL